MRHAFKFNILKECIEDKKFMEDLRYQADMKAGDKKFVRMDSGYYSDDFIKNYITVIYIYEDDKS